MRREPYLASRDGNIAIECVVLPDLQSWAVDPAVVRYSLRYRPRAVMLFFGDPSPFIGLIRAAGALLVLQVTDLEEDALNRAVRR